MITLHLHLKHGTGPVSEPAAWFISGANVAVWIAEICRWEIPQQGIRLFILPRSSTDRTTVGVLAITPTGVTPRHAPRALGFGVIGGKLYVPVDAILWPPVEAHELKVVHEIAVLHPGIGLVGFDVKDGITLPALLRQPPSRVENWNAAKNGIGINDRLRSIQFLAPISIEELFGDAPNQIGTHAPTDLPPTPSESNENIPGKLWDQASRYFAKGVFGFIQLFPHDALHRTWLNNVEDWAAAKMHRLSGQLDGERNKEVRRLLEKLKDNPEEGLKFAIPMSRVANHRGQAPPGNKLISRNTDFNLNGLRGGQAADFWDVSSDLQLQLRNQYRELANRELHLGRFRRAAYIFAELLGDLDSAASALKQGKHFREAAAIYKDHLHRPREAARCFAEGGLIVEAVEIYEKESCFVEAADLYAVLGQLDQATTFYERAVEKHIAAGDRLLAAKLLEDKLASPEKALQILAAGWPSSVQADKCLEAQFALLARHSWHRGAREVVAALREQTTRPDLVLPLVQVLSGLNARYPDHTVRYAAADLARVKASQQLENATPAEAVQLSDAIVKLAPSDKLLARDAVRFVAARNDEFRNRKRPTATPVRKTKGPVLIKQFELPRGVRWNNVKSCGSYFFSVGYQGKDLLLVRGQWEGVVQGLSWPVVTNERDLFLLEFDETVSCPREVILSHEFLRPRPILSEKAFMAATKFSGVTTAGTPDWLPDDGIAACCRGDLTWILRATGSLTLENRKSGRLIGNIEMDDVFEEVKNEANWEAVSLVVQRDAAWIAIGRRLVLKQPRKPLRIWEAESTISSIVSSAPHLPLGIVMRLERGVALQTLQSLTNEVETSCPELFAPLATYTADGTLILLSQTEGRICTVQSTTVSEIASFDWPGKKPIAVVRAGTVKQFAVFAEDGKVCLFRVD